MKISYIILKFGVEKWIPWVWKPRVRFKNHLIWSFTQRVI